MCRRIQQCATIGLLLGLELGLRIGEICGLQWGDFDLKLGTLNINRTVCRISCGNGHTKVVIQTPKTRTSRWEIPIPRQLLVILKKLRGNTSNFYMVSVRKRVQAYRTPLLPEKHQSISEAGSCPASASARAASYFCYRLSAGGVRRENTQRIVRTRQRNITLQRYVHSDLTRKRREMNRIFSHQVSMRGGKSDKYKWNNARFFP